jgi:hypothetical protein
MANAIRRFSLQIVSHPYFPRLVTLTLAWAMMITINAPIGGGGGGY